MSALPKPKAGSVDAVIAALRALPGRAERFNALFPLEVEISGLAVGRGARVSVRLPTRNRVQEPRLNAIPAYVLGTFPGVFVTSQPVTTAGTIYDRSVTGDRKQTEKVTDMALLFKTAERARCAFFNCSDLVGALLDSDRFCKPGDEPLTAAQIAAKRALVPQPLTPHKGKKGDRKLKDAATKIIAKECTKLTNDGITKFVDAMPADQAEQFKCWRKVKKVKTWAPILLSSINGPAALVVSVVVGDEQHDLPYVDFHGFYLECFGVKPMEVDRTLDEHLLKCALRWRDKKNSFIAKQRGSKAHPKRLTLSAGKIVSASSTSGESRRKRGSMKDSDDEADADAGDTDAGTALDAALDQVVDDNPELESAVRSFAVTLGTVAAATTTASASAEATTAKAAKPKRKRARKAKAPVLRMTAAGRHASSSTSTVPPASSSAPALSGDDARDEIAQFISSHFSTEFASTTTLTPLLAPAPVFVVVNVPEQHRALVTRAVLDPLSAPVFISLLLNKQPALAAYVRDSYAGASKSVLEIPHNCMPATSAQPIARGNAQVRAAFETGVRDEFQAMLERGGYARTPNTVDAEKCPIDPRSPNVRMTAKQVLIGTNFEHDVLMRGTEALFDIPAGELVGYYHGAVVKGGAHAIDGAAALSMCAGQSEKQATDEYVVGDVDFRDEKTGKILNVCVTASAPEYHQCVLAQAMHTPDAGHANAKIESKWDHAIQGLRVVAKRDIKAGQRVVLHYGIKYHEEMLAAGISVGTPVIDPPAASTAPVQHNSTFADSVFASTLASHGADCAEMVSLGLHASTNDDSSDGQHEILRALTTSCELRVYTPPPTSSTLFGADASPLVLPNKTLYAIDDDNMVQFENDPFDDSVPTSRWQPSDVWEQ